MFRVRFIDDAELPEGADWVLARCDDGKGFLFVKRSMCGKSGGCMACTALREATAAWERLIAGSFQLQAPAHRLKGLPQTLHLGALVAVRGANLGLTEDLRHNPVRDAGGFHQR